MTTSEEWAERLSGYVPDDRTEAMTYCGKDIKTMSREELIEALRQMARLYKKSLNDNIDAHPMPSRWYGTLAETYTVKMGERNSRHDEASN